MVGCAAGEGHLDGAERLHRASAEILATSITSLAREMNAPLIVLKEFSAQYRDSLQCLVHHGFARVPSMPNTRLNIDYANFDDYMNKALGKDAPESFTSAASSRISARPDRAGPRHDRAPCTSPSAARIGLDRRGSQHEW